METSWWIPTGTLYILHIPLPLLLTGDEKRLDKTLTRVVFRLSTAFERKQHFCRSVSSDYYISIKTFFWSKQVIYFAEETLHKENAARSGRIACQMLWLFQTLQERCNRPNEDRNFWIKYLGCSFAGKKNKLITQKRQKSWIIINRFNRRLKEGNHLGLNYSSIAGKNTQNQW